MPEPATGPPSDSEWVELDRVQWLHDHLPPDTADALARLITADEWAAADDDLTPEERDEVIALFDDWEPGP